LRNYTLIRLIRQCIRHYKLDLTGYNVLLPVYSDEPALTPIMAGLAGAKRIFVMGQEIEIVNRTAMFENELDLTAHITFLERENPQILSELDILLYGEGIPFIDGVFASNLNKDCIISMLPKNLDFNNTLGINAEECSRRNIKIIGVEPDNKNLSLYKHLAHVVTKRCSEAGVDVLGSKLLLISNGELSDNILSHLKNCGAQVYVAHTDNNQDKSYILKHLEEVDAVIVADYPLMSSLVIGNEGFIRVEDILNVNPEVKIIHLAGKMQPNALSLNRISYWPNSIVQNTLNVNIKELGLRTSVEIVAASMKAAESLIKLKDKSVLLCDSIVTYNIVNERTPVLLGKSIL
jgi:hypothetical protein